MWVFLPLCTASQMAFQLSSSISSMVFILSPKSGGVHLVPFTFGFGALCVDVVGQILRAHQPWAFLGAAAVGGYRQLPAGGALFGHVWLQAEKLLADFLQRDLGGTELSHQGEKRGNLLHEAFSISICSANSLRRNSRPAGLTSVLALCCRPRTGWLNALVSTLNRPRWV